MPRVAVILIGMLVGLALLVACEGSLVNLTEPTPVASEAMQTATPEMTTPTPRPTGTPTVTPSPTRTPLAGPPTAREDANLRAGPGVTFAKVGSIQAGDILQLVATNPRHDWVQVIQGPWILADLVANVPDLPVVEVPGIPPTKESPAAALTPTPES